MPQSINRDRFTSLASGTVILTLPLILGGLADLFGIRPAYGIVVILLVGVFLIILVSRLSPDAS